MEEGKGNDGANPHYARKARHCRRQHFFLILLLRPITIFFSVLAHELTEKNEGKKIERAKQ